MNCFHLLVVFRHLLTGRYLLIVATGMNIFLLAEPLLITSLWATKTHLSLLKATAHSPWYIQKSPSMS